MNISSRYDLSDIVRELSGSGDAATKGSQAQQLGPESVFATILAGLAEAGVTGKAAIEAAEAGESGERLPLSEFARAFLALSDDESGSTVSQGSLQDSLQASLKDSPKDSLQGAQQDPQPGSQQALASTQVAGLLAQLAAYRKDAVDSNRIADRAAPVSNAASTARSEAKPLSTLLTSDALRITKLKDSRAILLGPGVSTARAETRFAQAMTTLPSETAAASVAETRQPIQNLDQGGPRDTAAPIADDSPEYWNRETARLLAEMGKLDARVAANGRGPLQVQASTTPIESTTSWSTKGIDAGLRFELQGDDASKTHAEAPASLNAVLKSEQGAALNARVKPSDAVLAASVSSTAKAEQLNGINKRPSKFELPLESAPRQGLQAELQSTPAQMARELEKAIQKRGEATSVRELAIDLPNSATAKKQLTDGALARAGQALSANVATQGLSAADKLAATTVPVQAGVVPPRPATIPAMSAVDSNAQDGAMSFGQALAQQESTPSANTKVSVGDLPKGLASQINSHLARGLGSGPTKISISLFPENYGQVDVEFVYSEDAGLRVHLSSENVETARLLQSNSSALRESLLGGALVDVNVDVNSGSRGGTDSGSAERKLANAGNSSTSERTDQSEAPKASKSQGTDPSDGLDTYV